MKKVMLVLGALVMTLSGVAAVSAYEAHLVNVTAHVENALDVMSGKIDFGTVFPQEWFTEGVIITTSTSFSADDQLRVGDIYFKVYAAWKPLPVGHPDYPGFYPWLGEALYLGYYANTADYPPPADPKPILAGGDLVCVGAAPSGPPGVKPALGGAELLCQKFPLPTDMNLLVIGLDVPVFADYWNEHTDVATKPSGLSGPSYEIPTFDPDGVDLGVKLIIQVTRIE